MDLYVSMREEEDGRWVGRWREEASVHEVSGAGREECLARLRDEVRTRLASGKDGEPSVLVVEVLPRLLGVAEAARVMGWDKRRVITYLDRGRFPEPLQSLASGRLWLRSDVERFASEWRARARRMATGRSSIRLLLVRHAKPDLASRSFLETSRGRQWDPPLDEFGREQARRLGARLSMMDAPRAVLVSPFRRCRETVGPYLGAVKREAEVIEDLGEVFVGEWEGLSFEEIVSQDEELARRFREQEPMFGLAPGGESGAQLRARVIPAVENFIERVGAGTVVAVTHGGVINAYLGHVMGMSQDLFFLPDTASVNTVEIRGDRRRIRFLNDVRHVTDPAIFAPPP